VIQRLATTSLIGALAAISIAAPVRADWPPAMLRDVLVTSVENSRVGSGYLVVWDKVTVETRGGLSKELFSVSFGVDSLPSQGQRCDIRYHLGRDGLLSRPQDTTDPDWLAMDSFTCATASDQPASPSP
jgi:hypothetical protein